MTKNAGPEPQHDPDEIVVVRHPDVELPARVRRRSLAAMDPKWSIDDTATADTEE